MSKDNQETPQGDVKEPEEDFVDPWKVVSSSETGIDYNKLISKYQAIFNCVII